MIRNKLKIALASVITVLTLSGCSGIYNYFSGAGDTVANRLNWNIAQLDRLHDAGLLPTTTHLAMTSAISGRAKDLQKKINDGASLDGIADLKNSIRAHCTGINNKGDKEFKIEGKLESYFDEAANHITNGSGHLEVVAKKDADVLNNLLQCTVYTIHLKEGKDLADVIADIKTIDECQKGSTAKDKKGLDDANSEYARAVSSLYDNVESSGKSLADGIDDFFVETTDNDFSGRDNTSGDYKADGQDYNQNEINFAPDHKDLMIFSETVPTVAVRLYEINEKAIDKLLGNINSCQDEYITVCPQYNTGDTRIIKLVYPLNYVKSISWDGSKAVANIAMSDYVNVNIKTGKMELAMPSKRLTDLERQTQEELLNVAGTYNKTTGENNSSIIACGESNVEVLGEKVPATGLLLRDYLEYTYMPGLLRGENFAALGRRVRLKKLKVTDGNASQAEITDLDNFAEFIDRKGNPISDADPIAVSDLLDYRSGSKDYQQTGIVLSSSKPDSATTITLEDGTNDGKYAANHVDYFESVINNTTSNVKNTASNKSNSSSNTDTNSDSTNPGSSPVDKDLKVMDSNFELDKYTVDALGPDGWEQSNGRRVYKKADGTYAKGGWYAIPDSHDIFHFFHFEANTGYMDFSTSVDGYVIDANGYALDADGNIITTLLLNNESGKDSNNSTTVSTEDDDLVNDDIKRLTKTEYSSTIYPIVTFPFNNEDSGVFIDREDGQDIHTDKSADMFYGIFVNADLMNSQLYSGWIKGDDQTLGNLEWWNNWLYVNKYNYRIDAKALEEWLDMNFNSYVFDKDKDTITLNMKTLEAIQNSINQRGRINFVNIIRGLTVILGFASIINGMLLLAAWAVDTQFSFELKLTPIISFGKCVAVTDADEIGNVNTRDIKYLTFGGVMCRAFVMAMMGAALVFTDVISTLGGILNVAIATSDFIIGIITGR